MEAQPSAAGPCAGESSGKCTARDKVRAAPGRVRAGSGSVFVVVRVAFGVRGRTDTYYMNYPDVATSCANWTARSPIPRHVSRDRGVRPVCHADNE